MAQPCAKSAEGLRKASRAITSRFRGATLTSRIISPPLDSDHRLFPASSGGSLGHAQIKQPIGVGPYVIHHEENEDGDRHDRPEQNFSLVFHVHEVEQSDQSLDRCEYQQNEEEMLGFGTLIRDEDLDSNDGEESHPDTHIRPHPRIVFRCARRHIADLPFERLSARSSNTSTETRTSRRYRRSANTGSWFRRDLSQAGRGYSPMRLRRVPPRRT